VTVGYATTVGIVASAGRALVDEKGSVTPGRDAAWSLGWWIGADDRWHFPSQEPAVRQRLVDGTPVVETAMRVPGGDAVQRVYGTRHGDHEYLVVEIHNQSRVPFAVALALHAAERTIGLDGDSVHVNGQPAVFLPGRPIYAATGRDMADVVAAGRASDPSSVFGQPISDAAFLFPVAHTTVLRAAIPLDEPNQRPTFSALASSADVVKGWQAQTRRGLRLELPPGRLADAIDANRRHLLLLHEGRTAAPRQVAIALAQLGFTDESNEILEAELGGEPGSADSATLLQPLSPSQDGTTMARVNEMLDAASPTWTWPDRLSTATFCSLVRDLLVRDVPGGLSLCNELPPSWLGQSMEVHDAPTHAGRLSFAVRWHGQRPALLWELERREDEGETVRLTAPGLDERLSTTDRKGDALLHAVQESFH
jgi:hypothetical protein